MTGPDAEHLPDTQAGQPGMLPAVPADATTESGPASQPPAPVIYADITSRAGERRAIIPVPLQRANIRGTVESFAALQWHRVRYHGLRRLLAARSERDGKRISTRPLSEARIKRIHAVAHSALADTVPHTLPYNPAAPVKPGGKRGTRKVRKLLWTAPCVQRWRETGEVPAPVMGSGPASSAARSWTPWRPARTRPAKPSGSTRCSTSPPTTGCAARSWSGWRGPISASTGAACMSARRRPMTYSTRPKSEDSDRQIVIDEGTAAILRAWRKAQLAERIAWGTGLDGPGPGVHP